MAPQGARPARGRHRTGPPPAEEQQGWSRDQASGGCNAGRPEHDGEHHRGDDDGRRHDGKGQWRPVDAPIVPIDDEGAVQPMTVPSALPTGVSTASTSTDQTTESPRDAP